MDIVDSHAHLDMREFDADRDAVVQRTWDGGVKALLCPIELSEPRSRPLVLELCRVHAWITAAAGVHPHRAEAFLPSHLEALRELTLAGKIAAIGEIGIDHHYDFSPAPVQAEVFRTQLLLAQELNLPVIIHSRNAGQEVIAAIEETRFSRGGILHCFTEDRRTAERMIDRGFLVSFSGILTYRSASALRQIAASLPLEKLLVETDSPYLVPQALRNKSKRNEPLFVIETAKVLAEVKKVSLEDVAAVTGNNFRALILEKSAPA
ncbi:MAG: TatD family hydrolase [Candidatus Aminicenantes bacterium]|nr:TatD family hydrolase [Candidatus Aminicenantes bacterium]